MSPWDWRRPRRVFNACSGLPELRRLAARLSITDGSKERAVLRASGLRLLDPARMLETMRKQLPEAEIEILEYSRLPVPEGELEFPR